MPDVASCSVWHLFYGVPERTCQSCFGESGGRGRLYAALRHPMRSPCRTRHPPTRNVPLCLDFTSSISRSNRITLLYPWYTLGFRSLLGALVPSLYCFLPFFFHSPARHAGFLHPFFVYCVRILSEHRLLRAAHIVHFALGVPTIIMQWGGLYD